MNETKKTKCSIAAFMRRNGRWAIATRRDDHGEPIIMSAANARLAAGILRGDKSSSRMPTALFLATFFRTNFTEDLHPEIAATLERLAGICDRENSAISEWHIRGEVKNDREFYRDTQKLH